MEVELDGEDVAGYQKADGPQRLVEWFLRHSVGFCCLSSRPEMGGTQDVDQNLEL